MPSSLVLVDTNVYLRLARTIRPLLNLEFGEARYKLCIIPELNTELKSRRLQSRFPWVGEEEHKTERMACLQVSKKQAVSIRQTFEYLWAYVQDELPGPSRVDVLYIAYALELGCLVVTDDQDMFALAVTFEARVMPTLALMKLMLDCERITLATINALAEYWRYDGDLPANFKKDFKRFFS